MTHERLEDVLDDDVARLTDDPAASGLYHDPQRFEQHVRDTLRHAMRRHGLTPVSGTHPHAFPDVSLNGFGVEVKFTKKDAWLAVGNSVFEEMRTAGVERVHVVFGKAGGDPEARWARREDRATHARASCASRSVVEMDGNRAPLFDHMGVVHDDFRRLPDQVKTSHVRDYSRNRLRDGERPWRIEEEEPRAIPLEVRLHMRLPQPGKRTLRAEAAILSPKIRRGSRQRGRHVDAALHPLTEHGVFRPQALGLSGAGSAALRDDDARGGNYILRALPDIEDLMRDAAERLDGRLFEECWGADFAPEDRIGEWLRRADRLASGWRPSDFLFSAN